MLTNESLQRHIGTVMKSVPKQFINIPATNNEVVLRNKADHVAIKPVTE